MFVCAASLIWRKRCVCEWLEMSLWKTSEEFRGKQAEALEIEMNEEKISNTVVCVWCDFASNGVFAVLYYTGSGCAPAGPTNVLFRLWLVCFKAAITKTINPRAVKYVGGTVYHHSTTTSQR